MKTDVRFVLRPSWNGKLVVQALSDSGVRIDVPAGMIGRFPAVFMLVEAKAMTRIMDRIDKADKRAQVRKANKQAPK